MSRIIFKLNTNNTVEIVDSDFEEHYISVTSDGNEKIIEVSVTEENLEIINGEEYN